MFAKKFISLIAALTIAGSSLLPLGLAYAVTPTNLIANPNVSTPNPTNSAMPESWSEGGWGTNTPTYSYLSSGYNDTNSLKVQMTSYTSGDAKWYFTPVAVSASTSYTYSDYYESTVATDVEAQLTDSSGNNTYVDLGTAPAASSWTQYSENFTTASTTTSVTIFHLIESVGSLQTDDFSLTTASPVTTNPGNLIGNPTASSSSTATSTIPSGWQQGGWGTNTANYSYLSSGYSGSSALEVAMTSYTSGDAKWYFTPVNVTAGDSYTYSDYYQSNVVSGVTVQFDNGSGSYSYLNLANAPVSSTYAQYNGTFTVPTGMVHATVFHLIQSVGTLTTSDFSLAANSASTAPTVSISSPTSNATLSGTTTLKASASGASNVQFEVDGVNVGSPITASPYKLSWNSATVVDGTHSLTAIATNSAGQSTTSSPVSFNVSNNSGNMIQNPQVNIADPNNPTQPLDWSGSSWGTNTPTFTYLSSGDNDSNSLEVQMSNYSSGDAKWTFPNESVTPDVQYKFSEYYKSTVSTEVDAVFNLSGGTTEYQIIGLPSAESNWTQFSSSFVVPQGTQSMTIYHLIERNGTLTTDDFSLTPYTPTGFKRPLVTLTFDDGYSSTYQYATPILDADGYKSTQFIITDVLGTTGYMTDANLVALNKDGQEIASHTVTHDDLTTETTSQVKTELSQSQSTLQSLVGVPVTDIAYPYGEYNTTVQTQTAKYYTGARGVEDGLNSKDNFNAYDLKVQNVYNTTTTAQVADWVKQAQATNTWLIIVYHSVDLTSNSFDGTSIYNVTPTQLTDQLSTIKSSGVVVETMKQALAEAEPQV